MSASLRTWISGVLAAALVVVCSARVADAQIPKSEPLARQLAAAMDAAKLDSIAAADPSGPGLYVGALYIPNLQLIVVSARHPAAEAQDARLAAKSYRDVYLDLSAGGLAEKIVVEDMGVDGARVRRRNDKEPIDRAEIAGRQIVFDYDFRRQKLSLDDYLKAYATADERYAAMLQVLLAQIKKGN